MNYAFIGYDVTQDVSAAVCAYSLRKYAKEPLHIAFLNVRELRALGLFTRPWIIRENGQFEDMRDGKPFSTEFSHSRFLIQTVAPKDATTVLFCDSDFLFLSDPGELFALANPKLAMQCVKVNWQPKSDTVKMAGQKQEGYKRKLWSSMMLWNVQHASNKKVTPFFVNYAPGNMLHSFSWLNDNEIGNLPETWNWMDKITDRVKNPKAVHYTHGGPWLGGEHLKQPYADEWVAHYNEMIGKPNG